MAKKSSSLLAPSKAVDPTLHALFSASAGPVKAPPKSRYAQLGEEKPASKSGRESTEAEEEEDLSEISEELDYDDDGSDVGTGEDSQESADDDDQIPEEALAEALPSTSGNIALKDEPQRKRKRKEENADLESKYLNKLSNPEEPEPAGKRQKGEKSQLGEEELQDEEGDDGAIPVHESLTNETKSSELEKAERTVFLSNVSVEAISSKAAKKTLMNHLGSVLSEDEAPVQKVESIRFRSVAFSGGSIPKRAAYITKSLMESTTKSANAYAVYSTPAAARKAASELNGSEILGRHLRVDLISHPSPTDHRRCVFVGNLGFVDDETVLNTDVDGKTVEKKRNKVPSDIEEGLWRTFGQKGKVENVRVVRDSKTRVGKGFAYVQFYDANSVEAALLLDGKKFPPMLPRPLRVSRAKDPRKTALAQERAKAKGIATDISSKSTRYKPKPTPEQQSMAGRTSRLFGVAAAAHQRRELKTGGGKGSYGGRGALSEMKTPEQVVFEGTRASSKDGRPKDLKFGKKGKSGGGKPKTRSARRGTAWKTKSTQ